MIASSSEDRVAHKDTAGEAVSEILFNALVINGLHMRYVTFLIQELQPSNKLQRIEEKVPD